MNTKVKNGLYRQNRAPYKIQIGKPIQVSRYRIISLYRYSLKISIKNSIYLLDHILTLSCFFNKSCFYRRLQLVIKLLYEVRNNTERLIYNLDLKQKQKGETKMGRGNKG